MQDCVGQHFFKKFLFYIGVWLIYNVVLVSSVQQSDSVIHTHTAILFQNLFPQVITEYWVEFPVLDSRSLLTIYFVYSSSMYMLYIVYVYVIYSMYVLYCMYVYVYVIYSSSVYMLIPNS